MPKHAKWNFKLIRMGLPEHLFAKWLCRNFPQLFETGNSRNNRIDYEVEVIAVASYDTASAASVVPLSAKGPWLPEFGHLVAAGPKWATEPILTEEAVWQGSNEGVRDGRYCFAKYYRTLDTSRNWCRNGRKKKMLLIPPVAGCRNGRNQLPLIDVGWYNFPVSGYGWGDYELLANISKHRLPRRENLWNVSSVIIIAL